MLKKQTKKPTVVLLAGKWTNPGFLTVDVCCVLTPPSHPIPHLTDFSLPKITPELKI